MEQCWIEKCINESLRLVYCEYEDEIAQSVRQISAVVSPTLMLGAAGKAAGAAANTRVGWSIGQNKFVQISQT